MLQFIRDKAQGIFAWIIVGLITIPFALWGINQYTSGGREISAASVNGAEISQREVQVAYLQQRERLKQMFGDKLPENLFNEEVMKKQILQGMIENRLVMQTAHDNGMRVSDDHLAAEIHAIQAFQRDGNFSTDSYVQALRGQGMVPRQFEQLMRRDLLVQQFRSSIEESEFVTAFEAKLAARIEAQQRRVGYMSVPVKRFEEGVKVEEAQIEKYYRENIGRYKVPEQVSVEYLELSAAGLAAAVDVDGDEVRTRYEGQKESYSAPQERKASHLLLEVAEGADEATWQQAEAKANALAERVRGGESFADVARAESQDQGSAQKGGDLGFIARNSFDPQFEKALFSIAKVGDLSAPVRSAAGVHLIRLDELRGGEVKSFDSVRQQIESEIRNERAEERYYEMAEQFEKLVFESNDGLAPAAEALGLKVRSSPFFSRSGGSGIAGDEKVATAAFAEEVLLRGRNSEVVEVGDNHLVVVRLKEHKPEGERPLAEVRDAITATLRKEQATASAQEFAATLRDSLAEGKPAQELARVAHLEWREETVSRKAGGEIDAKAREALFRMPKEGAGSGAAAVVEVASGDRVVLTLLNVIEQDGELKGQQERLQRAQGTSSYDAIVAGYQAEAKVSILPQE